MPKRKEKRIYKMRVIGIAKDTGQETACFYLFEFKGQQVADIAVHFSTVIDYRLSELSPNSEQYMLGWKQPGSAERWKKVSIIAKANHERLLRGDSMI